MASRRGKEAKPRKSRPGPGSTPAIPYYLGTFDSPLSAETRGGVRKSQRPEGPALVEGQQTMLRQMAEAERELPELLERIQSCALVSDPLMLFSRLHAFDAMLRGVLPSSAMFGSDAVLEFYGGLVTAIPVEQVLIRLGADDDPQAFYDLHAALRDYALAEHTLGLDRLDRALIEGATNTLASAQRQLEFEHRFDRMFGFPAQLRPIFDAIVEPIADQAREQRAPLDAHVHAGMPFQRPQAGTAFHVPQLDRLVEAAAGEQTRIRARSEGQRTDPVAMPMEFLQQRALFAVPQPDDPIEPAAGQQAAIGTPGEGKNPPALRWQTREACPGA